MSASTRPASAGVRVSVVGAGVVGLTVAVELARQGHPVRLVADQQATHTVSGVAGAIWFPYVIDSAPTTTAQLTESRRRFETLADQVGTGVTLRAGLLIERRPDPDLTWMLPLLDGQRGAPVDPSTLPEGATAGFRLTVPMIDTPRYLRWLSRQASESGVESSSGAVDDLEQLAPDCDVIVVAAGLRSADLLADDDTCYPVRGQVVRLANPGLHRWLIDDDNPAGMVYVLPRGDDIVCGGTAEIGRADTTVDPATETAILQRCTAVVPELAGLPIVSRGVGLRPARPSVRLEVLDRWSRPVVTCYGHGGAGVTASWGSAAVVSELIAAL